MEASVSSIRIPMLSSDEFVEIFPDELPVGANDLDYNDLVDVLRSELAPLKVWRACAVEYHRQGFPFEFSAVLNEIVESLTDESVDKIYRSRADFAESMTDIYNALAAKALSEVGKGKGKDRDRDRDRDRDKEKDGKDEAAAKVVDYLRKADSHMRVNEYTWLIKGFYELKQGEFKRAEDNFKAVYDRSKGQNAAKRKYNFAALSGLGIVAYCQQRYPVALDHFVKAIQSSPNCGAALRLVVANCCFRLEQYDRAKAAVQRALAIEPASPEGLVLLALLEQVQARKSVGVVTDHVKRMEARSNAYEYCMVALALDPTCCMALVHMANHCSHNWKLLVASSSQNLHPASVGPEGGLMLRLADCKDISIGDHIRVNGLPAVYSVTNIASTTERGQQTSEDDLVVVSLSQPLSASLTVTLVETKEFGKVFKLVTEVINLATSKDIKAEAYYIMGKVNHMQGQPERALVCYRKSLAEADFMLAAFGAAQIQLSKRELASSYELFERVHQKYPDDKDTKAFFFLVKALHKKEASPMEQLREVCVGFQFEADLWLQQAQLRLDTHSEHPAALKCFMHAVECLEQKGKTVDFQILSNISVLHHSLGRWSQAAEYCKRALVAVQHSGALDLSQTNPSFKASDLNGVFYAWSETLFDVTVVSNDMFQLAPRDGQPAVSLHAHLSAGDDIIVGDVIYTVTHVSEAHFEAKSAVHLARTRVVVDESGEEREESVVLGVKVKQLWNNFCDESITLCYNYARMLEDLGCTRTSIEIYVELLKQHPGYMECYLRLSRIARDMGKFDEATLWLSRALAVDDKDPDVNVSLGDLYSRGMLWEDAKKCYEKICGQTHHDARAMLSLGNFYFTTLSTKDSKYEAHLKDSYKFYHHVLHEDKKNVYAANGLAMICAEKKELEVAREIFARARESNMTLSDDICINLAHVHYAQGRFVDAEHQYQATLKGSHTDRNAKAENMSTLCEYSAMAQFSNKRHEDSIRSLLRAIHYDPTVLRFWYNVALVRGDVAQQVIQKPRRLVADIETASEQLGSAHELFAFLASTTITQPRGLQFDKDLAQRHARMCEANKSVFLEQLHSTLEEEKVRNEQRKLQDEEHQLRRRMKEEEHAREIKALEDARIEKQMIAEQKAKKLEEMQEKWVAVPVVAKKGGKKGKGAAEQDGDDDDDDVAPAPADTAPKEATADSDDDDGDMVLESRREPTTGASSVDKEKFDDIFGSDDDDEEEEEKKTAPAAGKRKEAPSSSTKRKRVKRSDGDVSDASENSDLDDSTAAPTASKSRVIDDEDADE